MKVVFSARAQADLVEIYEFIALDSKVFAKRTVDQLIDLTRDLARFPNSGRIIARFNDPALRERFYRNYRIAYHVADNVIEIITIHHTAMFSEK